MLNNEREYPSAAPKEGTHQSPSAYEDPEARLCLERVVLLELVVFQHHIENAGDDQDCCRRQNLEYISEGIMTRFNKVEGDRSTGFLSSCILSETWQT